MEPELKQRLIGASVVIALAIIFVPMLFDGGADKNKTQNISIEIPQTPESKLEIKQFEIDKPAAQINDLPASEIQLIEPVDEQPELIKIDTYKPDTDKIVDQVDTEDENVSKPQEVVQNIPETPPTVDTTEEIPVPQSVEVGYRVKLGSFSQIANAQKIKNTLLQKGISTFVEYEESQQLYRVWSQQIYATKQTALVYAGKVKSASLNLGEPKIIEFDVEETSQIKQKHTLAWVLQLGSFSTQQNAVVLKNRIKNQGYQCFVDRVLNSAGQPRYRVRIGPIIEKEEAKKLGRQIKEKFNLDGLVKEHDFAKVIE
ncbi:MAG: SPOR domain-containing protein [Proteobacteria bacterium]|nr:SPOR domain-containing protein [Pseudomonadota bacterium]